jgi:transcription elongation factor Elf1
LLAIKEKGNKMKTEKLIHTSVNCAKCGSTNLKFDKPYFYADILRVAIQCGNCGLVGTQEYKLVFLGTSIDKETFIDAGESLKGE